MSFLDSCVRACVRACAHAWVLAWVGAWGHVCACTCICIILRTCVFVQFVTLGRPRFLRRWERAELSADEAVAWQRKPDLFCRRRHPTHAAGRATACPHKHGSSQATPAQVATRVLADAGMAPDAALVTALAATMASGARTASTKVTTDQKHTALVEVLAALARQRPLVLAVEGGRVVIARPRPARVGHGATSYDCELPRAPPAGQTASTWTTRARRCSETYCSRSACRALPRAPRASRSPASALKASPRAAEQVDEGRLRASLFVVLAIRSSDLDVQREEPYRSWLQRDDVQRLSLGELDDEAAKELVRQTAHGGIMPDNVLVSPSPFSPPPTASPPAALGSIAGEASAAARAV